MGSVCVYTDVQRKTQESRDDGRHVYMSTHVPTYTCIHTNSKRRTHRVVQLEVEVEALLGVGQAEGAEHLVGVLVALPVCVWSMHV